MEKEKREDGIDCWNCNHQKIGGNTFLGVCKERDKDIPSWVVDKGCSKYTTKYKVIVKEQLSLLESNVK